ncbi:MAG: hypothetical protein M3348_10450 [Acidobacteriota bacterium]|nr:hypothetical protein [Acidobacteriota bacterium]
MQLADDIFDNPLAGGTVERRRGRRGRALGEGGGGTGKNKEGRREESKQSVVHEHSGLSSITVLTDGGHLISRPGVESCLI